MLLRMAMMIIIIIIMIIMGHPYYSRDDYEDDDYASLSAWTWSCTTNQPVIHFWEIVWEVYSHIFKLWAILPSITRGTRLWTTTAAHWLNLDAACDSTDLSSLVLPYLFCDLYLWLIISISYIYIYTYSNYPSDEKMYDWWILMLIDIDGLLA